MSDFPRLAGIRANLTATKAVPSAQEVQFICSDPSHIMYTVAEPSRVILGNTFTATCNDATKELDGVLTDAVCKPGTVYNFINVNLVMEPIFIVSSSTHSKSGFISKTFWWLFMKLVALKDQRQRLFCEIVEALSI